MTPMMINATKYTPALMLLKTNSTSARSFMQNIMLTRKHGCKNWLKCFFDSCRIANSQDRLSNCTKKDTSLPHTYHKFKKCQSLNQQLNNENLIEGLQKLQKSTRWIGKYDLRKALSHNSSSHKAIRLGFDYRSFITTRRLPNILRQLYLLI